MFCTVFFVLCVPAYLIQNITGQELHSIAAAGHGFENQALRKAAANPNAAGYGVPPGYTPRSRYGSLSSGYAPGTGGQSTRAGYGMRPANAAGVGSSTAGCTGAHTGVETPAPTTFGGVGDGNMSVSGNFDVNGNTSIYGALPILGSVSFNGTLPASGTISVVGRSECRFF